MSRKDFGAAIPENGYSTVAFYVPTGDRANPRADGNGYVFAKLRVPTIMLREAFNSHIGSLPPQHDNMLVTDKPLLSLPVTLPLQAVMMHVVTSDRAAALAQALYQARVEAVVYAAPSRSVGAGAPSTIVSPVP